MAKNLKKPVSLRMSDDELDLLERVAEKYGGKSAAIIAGLRTLDEQHDMSVDDLLALLRRRLR